MIGSHTAELALSRGIEVVGITGRNVVVAPERPRLAHVAVDLADPDGVTQMLGQNADVNVIIHAAALTNVNQCERDIGLAYRLHSRSTELCAREAKRRGIPFIYVSSHAIFDGKTGGQAEDASPDPVNVYALTKVAGEDVSLAHDGHVVRAMPIGVPVAPRPARSFGEWLVNSVIGGADIQLFDDVRVSPTTPESCADFLVHLAKVNPEPRVWHLASESPVSKAEIGLDLIARYGDYAGTASIVSIDDAAVGVTRPKETWVTPFQTQSLARYKMPSAGDIAANLAAACLQRT